MLIKKLCKKCHRNIYIEGWNEFDEQAWREKGCVYCPSLIRREEEKVFRNIIDGVLFGVAKLYGNAEKK